MLSEGWIVLVKTPDLVIENCGVFDSSVVGVIVRSNVFDRVAFIPREWVTVSVDVGVGELSGVREARCRVNVRDSE
jgi:hypothetical protein